MILKKLRSPLVNINALTLLRSSNAMERVTPLIRARRTRENNDFAIIEVLINAKADVHDKRSGTSFFEDVHSEVCFALRLSILFFNEL